MLKKLKQATQNLNKKVFQKLALKKAQKIRLQKRAKIILVLAAGLLLSFRFKHLLVVATVNNRPVWRYSLRNEAEKRYGEQILENQVVQVLIKQAVAEKGVQAEPQELADKIQELVSQFEEQGMDLDSLLASQGQTRASLEEQIELQLLVEKILGKDIEVTDEEIEEYWEGNQDFFPEGATLEEKREEIKEQLRQQKISEKFQPWLEELREKAQIRYFLSF